MQHIDKTADRQVQAAIESVVRKIRELRSGRQTALWYRDNAPPLPEVVPGTRGRSVVWRLPTATRIRQILKNPCYAAALAYGRTEPQIVSKVPISETPRKPLVKKRNTIRKQYARS